ncbi:MAG: NnrU family protein [Stenotrophobium sp.]
MLSLISAALLFVAIHLLVSGTTLRDHLVRMLGEKLYLALFASASVGLLAWLIIAFVHVRVIALTPWMGERWQAAVLVFLAFELIVLGVSTKSPTAVGGEALLNSAEPARGILRITRHPALCGIALWAVTHMAFNPHADCLWFFGAFAVVALAGPYAIDAKRARKHGEAWQRFAMKTSVIPFAAILQGRNRLAIAELGWWKMLIAAVIYAGFLHAHAHMFGVAPV